MQNPFYIQQPDLVENYARGVEIGNAQQDRQRAIEQEQAAQEQQMQFQQDMYSVYSNPTAGSREYGALMMKYPSMAENIKKSWDVVSPDQQNTLASDMTQVYSALQNGRDDFAIQLLQEKADAARNSGDEEGAQKFEMMVETGKADPMLLKDSTGMTLFAIKGKDYLEGLQKAPYGEVEAESAALKNRAEAEKVGAEAAVAEESAVLDVTNKAEDVKGKQLKQKLDVIDSQIKSADSQEKRDRLQLDRDKLQAEVDKMALEQSKVSQVEGQAAQDAIDTASTGIDTVNTLMKHPGLRSGTGRGGDFAAWFNGSDAADFRAQLETVKSQQFLNNIKSMKAAGGAGALSDAEGKKLDSAVASLDTAQSPQQLLTALGVIRTSLRKAQEKAISRGKAPTSGGTVVADTKKYGKIKDGDINRILEENPGATREQVIKFLQTQGQ